MPPRPRDPNATGFPESIDPDSLGAVLSEALARGGDFAEVFLERRVTRSVRLEEGSVRVVRPGIDAGAGVRVIDGERTGYACTDDPDVESIREAARAAARIATSGGGPRRVAALARTAPGEFNRPRILPADLSIDDRVSLVRRIDRAARKADPRIVHVIAGLSDEQRTVRIANSDGLLVDDTQALVGATATVLIESAGRRERGHFAAGGRDGFARFERVTPESVASEAVRRALVQLEAVDAPAGRQPVVIGNGWGGVLLHEAIGHGFEADFVRRGTSVFNGRVGQQVASALCTIVDDGSIPHLRGTVNVDDEGEPGRPTVLIDRGRLAGYLHDRLSARRLAASPTGNGRRQSYRCPPIPRQTNLYMAAGGDAAEDIIRGVNRGFYARHIGGGQVDITSGSFVFQVTEGYLIEDGRLTAPVRNANLAGVGQEVLGRVVKVGGNLEFDPGIGVCGKEGQHVPVGVGQPTLLVSEMTVGGTRL